MFYFIYSIFCSITKLVRYSCLVLKGKNTDFGEVGEKSSHYGLYMLGFTRATKVNTKSTEGVTLKKSLKITPVLIRD